MARNKWIQNDSLGKHSNKEIKPNTLPVDLHTLVFGDNFNKEIEPKVLPDNLHTLKLAQYYNQEMQEASTLPQKLHILILGV
jgi:hypothetical protein